LHQGSRQIYLRPLFVGIIYNIKKKTYRLFRDVRRLLLYIGRLKRKMFYFIEKHDGQILRDGPPGIGGGLNYLNPDGGIYRENPGYAGIGVKKVPDPLFVLFVPNFDVLPERSGPCSAQNLGGVVRGMRQS
jgi:hypothetical protein